MNRSFSTVVVRGTAAVFGVAAVSLLFGMVGSGAAAADSPYVAFELSLGRSGGAANDVNASGQVVGVGITADGATRGFSWTQAGGMVVLDRMIEASWVGDSGQVVGQTTGPPHAVSWTRDGGYVDLGTLGGSVSGPQAVSNSGSYVAGLSQTSTGEYHAFLWSRGGGMTDLGNLGVGNICEDVNDQGEVVGVTATPAGERAFSWTQTGGMVILGTLGGGGSSIAKAVNDAGQVVGSSTTASGAVHAFLWTQAGGMVDLGTLGGGSSSAEVITEAGEVAGESQTATDTAMHVFSWTRAGGMRDLGALGAAVSVLDISESGQVVGFGATAAGPVHAFTWTETDGMLDLGTFDGLVGSVAFAVNDAGQVVGRSLTSPSPPGQQAAVIWQRSSTQDVTAPTLLVPSDFAVDAESSVGARVEFTVSAVDAVDAAPRVSCAPESGTTFAVGDTTVSCTAGDASGNTVTASFIVHVRGAAEQLANLAVVVHGIGPGTSLANKVAVAAAALSAGNTTTASSILKALTNEVTAESGKKIPRGTASALTVTAKRIIAVLA